jgi:MFS family permease
LTIKYKLANDPILVLSALGTVGEVLMIREERQRWLVATALFLTLVLVYSPPMLTMGIFFTPLVKDFGYSHARVSSLSTVTFLITAISSWLSGRLLERIDARILIIGGALLVTGAFLGASRATHFASLIAAYSILGVGVGLGTLVPATVVVTNWFDQAAGKAMAFVISGATFGGILMVQVGNLLINSEGLRFAYVGMAVPVILSLPVVFFFVRTRPSYPPSPTGESTTLKADLVMNKAEPSLVDSPGYEVGEALRTWSFWMIALATICCGFVSGAVFVHLSPYIIRLGYSANMAATALSTLTAMTALSTLGMGALSDSIGPKIAIAISFLCGAVGAMAIVAGREPSLIIFGILAMGTIAAPAALMPVLLADSMGKKRNATLQGIIMGLILFLAAAAGPFIQGWLYDLSGSYITSFRVLAVVSVAGACFALTCKRYQREDKKLITGITSTPSMGHLRPQ